MRLVEDEAILDPHGEGRREGERRRREEEALDDDRPVARPGALLSVDARPRQVERRDHRRRRGGGGRGRRGARGRRRGRRGRGRRAARGRRGRRIEVVRDADAVAGERHVVGVANEVLPRGAAASGGDSEAARARHRVADGRIGRAGEVVQDRLDAGPRGGAAHAVQRPPASVERVPRLPGVQREGPLGIGREERGVLVNRLEEQLIVAVVQVEDAVVVVVEVE